MEFTVLPLSAHVLNGEKHFDRVEKHYEKVGYFSPTCKLNMAGGPARHD
jgi:hypothetical protein